MSQLPMLNEQMGRLSITGLR